MTLRKSIGIGAALMLLAIVAHADPCKMTVESNDVMQYNVREMVVPASCTEVEVSLRHSGQLAAKVMGLSVPPAKVTSSTAISCCPRLTKARRPQAVTRPPLSA